MPGLGFYNSLNLHGDKLRLAMRVAIIHYWLLNRRGGEKVLDALDARALQALVWSRVTGTRKSVER